MLLLLIPPVYLILLNLPKTNQQQAHLKLINQPQQILKRQVTPSQHNLQILLNLQMILNQHNQQILLNLLNRLLMIKLFQILINSQIRLKQQKVLVIKAIKVKTVILHQLINLQFQINHLQLTNKRLQEVISLKHQQLNLKRIKKAKTLIKISKMIVHQVKAMIRSSHLRIQIRLMIKRKQKLMRQLQLPLIRMEPQLKIRVIQTTKIMKIPTNSPKNLTILKQKTNKDLLKILANKIKTNKMLRTNPLLIRIKF